MNPRAQSYHRFPCVLFSVVLAILTSNSSGAASFVVTSNADDGPGSFRQALLEANAAVGPHNISFADTYTVALATALPELTRDGVSINGVNSVLLGNSYDGTGLVVSGSDCVILRLDFRSFGGIKVRLTGDRNVVRACLIGSSGSRGGGGVLVEGSDNVIGGLAEGDGNIISGNSLYGVRVDGGSGNQILGNRIGTQANGTTANPNDGSGIVVYNAPNTMVGSGDTPYGGNLVSGNLEHGIVVSGLVGSSSTGTTIMANFVGTDVTGTQALKNHGEWGIRVKNTDGVTVGSVGSGRNVVCRALNFGISGLDADGLIVQGNYAGLGLGAGFELIGLGNSREGISLANCDGAVVEDNVIGGNDGYGIAIVQSVGAAVRRNHIGVTPWGQPVRNFSGGIRVLSGTSGSLIGGYDAADGNVISFNRGHGVLVTGTDTVENTIARNSIQSNVGAGIVLADGGNAGLAAPLLTSIAPLTGTAKPESTVEFFADAADEGGLFLGSVVADITGAFSSHIDLLLKQGRNVTATATDGDNNTSAFSAPVAIGGLCAAFEEESPFVPIPEGGVLERSVIVPAGTMVEDIDVSINITHPAVEELILQIRSPSGTWVTLSAATVSGANLLSTIFDDQAAAPVGDGTAPYTGRFQPVSPLSAFVGESATGTWLFEVEDTNGAGNAGQLRGFGICINPVGSEGEGEGEGQNEGEADPPCTGYPSDDVGLPLVANATLTSTLDLPGSLYITDLEVLTSITCNSASALELRLESPWGQEVLLFTELDNDGQDFNGRLDDEAETLVYAGFAPYEDSYRPQQALSVFDGKNAAGTWTLTVKDMSGSLNGSLESWALCLAGESTSALVQCPEGHDFAQPPDLERDPGYGVISQLNSGSNTGEHFWGLTTPITAVTWWGYFAEESLGLWSACDQPVGGQFYMGIFPNNGPAAYELYQVTPVVEPTGVFINALDGLVELKRYTWTLPEPVALESGRVDIVYYFEQACVFHWMTSPEGNGTSGPSEEFDRDLSLCLAAEFTPSEGEVEGVSEGEGEGVAEGEGEGGGEGEGEGGGEGEGEGVVEGEGEPDPPCTGYPSSNTPQPLEQSGVITSTIAIPGPLYIDDLEVLLSIECDAVASLDVRLEAPWGQEIVLFTELDNDGQDFQGSLDDEADTLVYAGFAPYEDSYRPQQPLSGFDGADAAGVWTLSVSDLGSVSGSLDSWALCIAGQAENPALVCGDGYVQPPDTRSDPGFGAEAMLNGGSPIEDFADLTTPIVSMTWWGYFASESGGEWSGCTPPQGFFSVVVRRPEGTLVTQNYFVDPEVEDTGITIGLSGGTAMLQRFRWVMPEPLNLSAGTISIVYHLDTPCRFFWMTSPEGDGVSPANPVIPRDLSLCLEAAWSPVDPDPPCTATAAADTPVNLVGGGTVESSLSVLPGDLVTDVDVMVDLVCNSTAALDIRLRSPLGTEVVLASSLDAEGADFDDTLFDDEARIAVEDGTPPFDGAFRPAGRLGTLDGQPAGGTWTLIVTDLGGGSTGAIEGWSLCLAVESGAVFDCPAESGASQPPFDPSGTWSALRASNSNGEYTSETFSGVVNPITALSWWGYFAKDEGGGIFSACEPLPVYSIYLRRFDDSVIVQQLSSRPVVESTGQVVELNGVTVPVLRHWVPVPGTTLPEGLLDIAVSVVDGCGFYWLGSANGDGAHLIDLAPVTGFDLSLCLVTPEPSSLHTADRNFDNAFNLSELLRVIQLYNAEFFGCDDGTEDGYAPADPDTGCLAHASDYEPHDWRIELSELLRLIQLFNVGGYRYCPADGTEDGFCPDSL